MATRGYYEEYSLEELEEKFKTRNENFDNAKPIFSIEEKLAPGDDKLLSNTWTEAYKMAAYFWDSPPSDFKLHTFNSFRFHFAGLLARTKVPNELPDLKSRRNFVSWVCKKHNEFLEVLEEKVRVDCSDLDTLIKTYGPNHDNVKDYIKEYEWQF